MSATPLYQELQSLAPSAMIELFEIDATKYGGDILRFVAHTNEFGTDVVWQGNTYIRMPIDATGFDLNTSGTLPRPSMSISNIQGAMAGLARQHNYFLGCRVTRKRTFVRFLDAVNFPPGSAYGLEADPNQHLPDDIWYVDRKASENSVMLVFELASVLDLPGVRLPRRQYIQNVCAWQYRSAECGYTGGAVAEANGNPTSDATKDHCGRRLSDCKLRFGATGTLPFGGFPASGLL